MRPWPPGYRGWRPTGGGQRGRRRVCPACRPRRPARWAARRAAPGQAVAAEAQATRTQPVPQTDRSPSDGHLKRGTLSDQPDHLVVDLGGRCKHSHRTGPSHRPIRHRIPDSSLRLILHIYSRSFRYPIAANVSVAARDRIGLERRCRYAGRPPIPIERLSLFQDRRLLYPLKRRWRNGTMHVIFEPLALVDKVAALVPARD